MAGKRGQGEGSIYQRDDGRWTATISLGYKDGKRVRKSFYGKTRREVQNQLTVALRELQQGIAPANDKQTTGQCLATWLESVKPSIRPRTWIRYEQYVRVHALPDLAKVPLSKLGPPHLQQLYAKRLAVGASPTTVNHLHAVLHKALDQ